MNNYCIYLSGAMSNLSFEEQNKWRQQVKDAILYSDYDLKKNPVFFNPVDYFNFEIKEHKTEKEPFEYDLHQLRNSDLVIVNFNAPNSIGTAMELMLAYELRIPVIGLNKDGVELHPWLEQCCMRICTNMRELCDYVVKFFLN